MRLGDVVRFGLRAASGYRTRTLLMLLAMAIGVGSVVMLSSLGESARDYVVQQFSSLGTNLLIVLPGRSETVGGPPPLLGVTPRDLTIEDAMALQRSAVIRHVAPIALGAAPVSYGAREREVTILGSTPQLFAVRQLTMARGQFLPEGDMTRGAPVVVLGSTVNEELFGNRPSLGEWLRIGEWRFRVIGVLAQKGESVGLDMGDVAIVPVASALALFDSASLFRIMVEAIDRDAIARAKTTILRIIRERHEGEDDVTVVTQDAVLATFDRIFTAMTLTVTGIGAISISVAGILIMNVMLIAVSQRRAEVGLLKAVGAKNIDIILLFLGEALVLSLVGAGLGLATGILGLLLVAMVFPALPLTVPGWALAAAVAVALVAGLLFGILPALRAARLDPVAALARR